MKSKILHRLLLLAPAVVMALTLLPMTARAAGSIWDGTAADTNWYDDDSSNTAFTISSAEELAGLAKLVNDDTEDFTGITITLGADIDLGGQQWTPIGWYNVVDPEDEDDDEEYCFNGTFDGDGYTISNLTIGSEDDPSELYYNGLFGAVGEDGMIENLGVVDFVVYADGAENGGLAGRNYGSIKNCYATGSVAADFLAAVGGLVGANYEGRIENCFATASVTVGSICFAGGLVGNNYGDILNCYATGSVIITDEYAFSTAGGLVGVNGVYNDAFDKRLGSIENCYATGSVISADEWITVGGLVGMNDVESSIANGYFKSAAGLEGVGGFVDNDDSNCDVTAMSMVEMISDGTGSLIEGLTDVAGSGAWEHREENNNYKYLPELAVFYDDNPNTSAQEASEISARVKKVPGAPTDVSATAGNSQATVTFTAPDYNGGFAITEYTVTSSPGGITATGISSPITVTGLTNGTAYTFTVTATNEKGIGDVSEASNSVTPRGSSGSGSSGSAQPSHGFIGGNIYTQGSGKHLIHITQKDFSRFSGVRVDGKTLTRDTDYKAESSSTKITLYAEYLDTLSVGKHTLAVYFTDGVTVTAELTVKAGDAPTPQPWGNPFEDVAVSVWYYGDVEYVYTHGLMSGSSASPMLFSPQTPVTRGMIVTILYRQDGSPDVSGLANPFSDVAGDKWYYNAIKWAAANGIVSGYDGKFSPEANITRQDLAVILWRYAKYAKFDVSAGENTNILSYNDAFDVAEYTIPAMQWACGAGIIGGKSGGLLDPLGTSTRAETAAMLHRLLGAALPER